MEHQYSAVKHHDNQIMAYLGNTHIVIEKSVSVLYIKKVAGSSIQYDALKYGDHGILRMIEKFIRGQWLDFEERETLQQVVVRFGWLDKTLNQLIWLPLVDLVEGFVNKTLVGTDKGKFQEICKQLSLSLKDARKLHLEDGELYDPRTVIFTTPSSTLYSFEVV